MSRTYFLPVIASLIGVSALAVWAQETPTAPEPSKPAPAAQAAEPELPKCPVSGNPIDFFRHAKTETGLVYFCCGDCIDAFKKEPAKYADAAKAQRAALEKLPRVQVSCPMSGEPINKDVFIERDGKKLFFCCEGCREKMADPSKHQAEIDASFTYQVKCPVMGTKITPAQFVSLPSGEKVYMCCKGCPKRFAADPARFASRLEKQGIKLDLDKIKSNGGFKLP